MAVAVASLACLAVAPSVAAAAADPDHVNFTLEGCRLPAGETLPNTTTPAYAGQYVCDDADYTTGNLGKSWNELDLVPHRLTADTSVAQTYAVAITADNFNGGAPGYDVISVPVVNAALSTGDCSVIAGPQETLTPGAGGTDTSIYRLLTITQGAGSHCVFDYYERLALGSHLFSGSSLHSNLLNQQFGTAGIGARDVSIPVKEILPQGLSKTMTATTGNATSWNVTKDSTPSHLQFDTCASGQSARTQGVTITVNWTKTTVDSGQVTTVSNITLDNPASRAITATVADKVYEGTNHNTQVGTTYSSGAVVVQPNSTRTVTNTQTFALTPGVTHYNDVATATYTDLVTGVVVPGNTTATAGADLVTVPNVDNSTATITDTEQITGTGLTFSIDSVSLAGAGFTPAYTAGSGDQITGPITWSSGVVSGSGGVVFEKTVQVAGALNTTGSLSDVATLTDKAGNTSTASASTSIVARACIQGQKFEDRDADGVKDPGEPGLAGVRIYVDLNGNGAFDAGEPSAVTAADGTYSISTAGIADGTYALNEVLPAGYVCSYPASCSHSITVGPGPAVTGQDFGNYRPASVSGLKYGDANDNGVKDNGETGLAGFTFYADANGNGTLDAGEPSAVSAADGTWTIPGIKPGAYTIREVGKDGYVCTQPSPCTYQVTLSSGDAVNGRIFGNYLVPPPPPPAPPAPVVSPVVAQSPAPAPAPVVPAPVVKPATVVSGVAALYGPKRCVTNNFVASVTGRQIAKVQFYVNNRLVATRTQRTAGRYSYTVKATSLSYAVHKLTAKVTYVAAARTKVKTMSFSFSRCAKAAVSKFTG
jgi:hypothetical protein